MKSMKKSSHSKKSKSKDKHRRSGGGGGAGSTEAPGWDTLDVGDLEGADEKFLQKRRLQLQRELRLQLKKEKSSKSSKSEKISSRAKSSSSDSSDSSSSSSSSSSKDVPVHKKRKSPSPDSGSSTPTKHKSSLKFASKSKVETKKKSHGTVSSQVVKKITHKKSPSPKHRRASPPRKKCLPRSKVQEAPKQKSREPSPRRLQRSSDWRPTRPRSPERKPGPSHASRPRHGGLQEGGKILPLKSSAYVREMKETIRRKSPAERPREDREKEKRSRESKPRLREQSERRDREREAERVKRDLERQKEREVALQRSRERQRERERLDRIEREKRKEAERKAEKNDLPSLLDIKTEVPRDAARLRWPERRRRPEDSFEFRRKVPEEPALPDERKGRKKADAPHTWEDRELRTDHGREHKSPAEWCRPPEPRPAEDPKGEKWRGQYANRPPPPGDWHSTLEKPKPEPPSTETIDPEPRPSAAAAVAAVVVTANESFNSDAGREALTTPVAAAATGADLEEAFSDISDDPDDILNQDDVVPPAVTHPVAPPSILPSPLPSAPIVPPAEFFFDTRRPILDCLAERGLDFEEISDEELEEEAKLGKGIMDVLGADWASLLSKPEIVKKRSEDGSARKRWQVSKLISRLGISQNLVDDAFSKRYLTQLTRSPPNNAVDLKVKEEPMETETESGDAAINEPHSNGIKTESSDEKPNDSNGNETGMESLHPLAGVHSLLADMEGYSPLTRLLRYNGGRALSANLDLSIRRVSNNLPQREHFQLSQCDEASYETALALFKSAAA